MTTATINMTVDADTAEIFREAPAEDRSKLRALWSILVREYGASQAPLQRLMDEISAKAESRGLTPAKLDEILNADR